jgi:hypothetical protein
MRLLAALGIIGGASWIAYAFVPEQCAPVTVASEVFCNRLWTPALFGITLGSLAVVRWTLALGSVRVTRWLSAAVMGGVFMTLGNLAEFWLFFDWPHDGPDGWLRSSLWVAVLIGWLAYLLASFGAGLFLLLGASVGLRIRALGAILVTAPCLTPFMGPLAIGVLAIAASLFVLVAGPLAPTAPTTPPEAAIEPA